MHDEEAVVLDVILIYRFAFQGMRGLEYCRISAGNSGKTMSISEVGELLLYIQRGLKSYD